MATPLLSPLLRYFFNQSKFILDEFSTYFMIWRTLAGIVVALRFIPNLKSSEKIQKEH